jgi:predicted 2-oxoglutarate/Fe(II)-dependent dioxygenase YbiX
VNDVVVINNFMRDGDCNRLVSHIDHLWDNFNLEPRGLLKHRLMRYDDKVINNLTQEYALAVKELVQRYEDPGYDLFTTDYGIFVSHEGYEMQPHIDTINDYGLFDYLKYAAVVYLNDLYEGGEIYFPNIGYSYSPKKGDLIMFPANSEEYLHGVSKVLNGNRYTLAYWYSEDGDWTKYFS